MRRIIVALTLIAASAPAYAQTLNYFVVQNLQTRRCSIMTEKPVTASAVVVGDMRFDKLEDAAEAMANNKSCN